MGASFEGRRPWIKTQLPWSHPPWLDALLPPPLTPPPAISRSLRQPGCTSCLRTELKQRSGSDHLVQVPLEVALLHVNLLVGLDHVLQLLLSLLPLLELRGDTGRRTWHTFQTCSWRQLDGARGAKCRRVLRLWEEDCVTAWIQDTRVLRNRGLLPGTFSEWCQVIIVSQIGGSVRGINSQQPPAGHNDSVFFPKLFCKLTMSYDPQNDWNIGKQLKQQWCWLMTQYSTDLRRHSRTAAKEKHRPSGKYKHYFEIIWSKSKILEVSCTWCVGSRKLSTLRISSQTSWVVYISLAVRGQTQYLELQYLTRIER